MFRIDLSEQMLMAVMNALGNHAYREAAPVITELQRQVNAQMPRGNGKIDGDRHDRNAADNAG